MCFQLGRIRSKIVKQDSVDCFESQDCLVASGHEDDATYLLHKAEECALSDSCSVDDARLFLREVIHLESGCAAGTLVGDDICNDQQHVAEIVASLRAKVERGETTGLE